MAKSLENHTAIQTFTDQHLRLHAREDFVENISFLW